MGKLMKAAVLGGIADAFNGFATAKAQREQQQILFDRQDQQAKEEKEFRAEQAKLQRQARGFFLPGEEEEESAYDRMQAKNLQRKLASEPKPDTVDPETFFFNGGATVVGVPEDVSQSGKPIDLSGLTVQEKVGTRQDAIITRTTAIVRRMMEDDNSLSVSAALQKLMENNPTISKSIRNVVMDRLTKKRESLNTSVKDGELAMPTFITGGDLFPANQLFGKMSQTFIDESNNQRISSNLNLKEYLDNYNITTSAPNVALRAESSIGASTRTVGGASVPPKILKLKNDRFVALQEKVNNESISLQEFYSEMRVLMDDPNATEDQIVATFAEVSTGIQPLVVSNTLMGDRSRGFVNPSFTVAPTNASELDKRNRKNALELQNVTRSSMKIAINGNVDVGPASSNINKNVSTIATTLIEGATRLGQKITGAVNIGTEGILNDRASGTIRNELLDDLETTINSIDNVKGFGEDQKVNLVAKLEKFKADLASGSGDDQTYLFNFQRIKLAYLYAKFIQGGGGGNAVSNADFDRNFEALFGVYSTDKNVVLADMLRGLASIHNDATNSIEDANFREKYTGVLVPRGQNRFYMSPSARRVVDLRNRQRGDGLDEPGYQATARYLIRIIYPEIENLNDLPPLLRAMLVSQGQTALKQNMASAGVGVGGGDDGTIKAAGSDVSVEQNNNEDENKTNIAEDLFDE
jgi:hypothetical protein